MIENSDNSTAHIQASSGRPKSEDPGKVSAVRVIVWVLLFQLAWNFRSVLPFLKEGSYTDSDDFLRLHQIRNWMAGQGWYDVSVPRMNLPAGGDMHWSRLVDIPLGGLIWFFDLFVDVETAERLASIVWPTVLLIATVFILIAACEKLFPKANRLLALLFIVTCGAAIVEFAPSRIDHHGFQILLFSITLLGLVNADGKWGHILIGASVALSFVIGLDALLLLLFILGWLGVEWAIGFDESGKGLRRTALAMVVTSLASYPIFVSPAEWLVPHCDANSIVYLSGLWAISAAFLVMSFSGKLLRFDSQISTVLARLALGGVLALTAIGLLYSLYPQCSLGPMSSISPELKTAWLDNIVEAKGLIAYVSQENLSWIGMPIYLLLVITMGLYLIIKSRAHPRLLALLVVVVIVFALGFFQVRTYRIGIFAIVPICVIIAQHVWQYFSQRYANSKIVAMAATALICAFLISPTWLVVGSIITKPWAKTVTNNHPAPSKNNRFQVLDRTNSCLNQSEYALLGSLPEGNVMNSIDAGPPILVFTHHSVVGGNYHRNADAILDIKNFFGEPEAAAKKIADRRKIDYVAFCWFPLPNVIGEKDSAKLGIRLMLGDAPGWLKAVSPDDSSLVVYKVVKGS